MRPPLSGRCSWRVLQHGVRAVGLACRQHGRGCSLPDGNPLFLGQPVGQLREVGGVGVLDHGQRLRALLRLAPCRDHPDQDVPSRRRDGSGGRRRWLNIPLVEVGFVAPVDGIERVMDGQMHHCHRPADDDVVLAAGNGGVEPGNVPVENLIGGRLVRKSRTNSPRTPIVSLVNRLGTTRDGGKGANADSRSIVSPSLALWPIPDPDLSARVVLCDDLYFSLRYPCFLRNTLLFIGFGSHGGGLLAFLFGNMALDGVRRELRSGSALLPLEPQVFDLLEFLVRNRDHVVSRDDLLAAVWNGRIVSDSAIDARINAARRAIGDDGEQQRWIRTFARKGFRFVGECP